MTIVRWAPFTEHESMERRMRRFFEELRFVPALVPAADIYETDDEYVLELDVPGFEEKELTVEVTDHTVAIKGRREKETEETTKDFALQERLARQFERRFILPMQADTARMKATFAKGVLEVHTPKVAATSPKQVEITKA